MTAQETTEWIELSMDELEELLEEARAAFDEEKFKKFQGVVNSFVYLKSLVEDKQMTIDQLRKLLFGSRSEKTSKVFGEEQTDDREASPAGGEKSTSASEKDNKKNKPKGHGRNGAAAYVGAEKEKVAHESPKPESRCR